MPLSPIQRKWEYADKYQPLESNAARVLKDVGGWAVYRLSYHDVHAVHERERVLTGRCLPDMVTVHLQGHGECDALVGVVLDDQDAHDYRSPSVSDGLVGRQKHAS